MIPSRVENAGGIDSIEIVKSNSPANRIRPTYVWGLVARSPPLVFVHRNHFTLLAVLTIHDGLPEAQDRGCRPSSPYGRKSPLRKFLVVTDSCETDRCIRGGCAAEDPEIAKLKEIAEAKEHLKWQQREFSLDQNYLNPPGRPHEILTGGI
jgi:hypothetical protein